MPDLVSDPAVGVSFSVIVDGHDLGAFTSCEGLGMEVTVEEREEGGNHLFVHQLPGRLKYTHITLTRAVNADTAKLAQWVASMASNPRRTAGQIVAMTHDMGAVVRWGLIGVIPVKWTGPQFSAESPKVATETLELAHHGFDPTTTGAP
jgi:phage tail-like protein